ncbi:MAG: hypothetical protein IV092_26895 [Burkholderiaceae bacterium]|nr:hypothetical protein [Burkholderiaceae bacterium]
MSNDWESRIDALYAAAGDRDALANALAAFTSDFDANKVVIFSTDNVLAPGCHFVASHGISDEAHVTYHAHYAAEDEWVRAAVAQGIGKAGDVFLGSELVTAETLSRTRFWHEYCTPHGHFDVVGGVLESPQADSMAQTYLSYIRGEDQTPVRPLAKEAARALVPHARRVLALHRRLAPQLTAGQSLMELFERMELPMVFLDLGGQVLRANHVAHGLLREGRLIRLAGGAWAQASIGGRWQALAGLLGRLVDVPGFELMLDAQAVQDEAPRAAHVLSIQRVNAGFDALLREQQACAVLSLRPAALRPNGGLLRQHFGLTETELCVAQALADGLGAQEVADSLGIRLTTVRTHIANLLAKTGSQRQSAMLRRLGALG